MLWMGRTGRPLFRLGLSLELRKTFFGSSKNVKLMRLIKIYGVAIDFAERYLAGERVVDDKGVILGKVGSIKGDPSELELKTGRLSIDDNAAALYNMSRFLRGEIGREQQRGDSCLEGISDVHFHYGDGRVERVMAEKGGLYLPNVRDAGKGFEDEDKGIFIELPREKGIWAGP